MEGSALIRHVVKDLRLAPPSASPHELETFDGTYALDDLEAVVARGPVTAREANPVTGATVERRYPASTDATLMTWRSDFPREGVARIGWVALPRRQS